jgi:hypothetical protein
MSPSIDNHDCKKYLSLIQSSRFSGSSGTGRDTAQICLMCGKIFIWGDRNFNFFEISLHITSIKQAEAIRAWVDLLNQE